MGIKDDESCIRFGMNVGSLIHAFPNGSVVAKTVVRDIKRWIHAMFKNNMIL